MSDILDKLAKNVGSWSAAGFYKAGMKNEDYEILNDCQMEGDWEKRRKQMINEPDDMDAPEWAKWKAQDSCGKWFWYITKTRAGESFWLDNGAGWQVSNNGDLPVGHDWTKTLKEVGKVDNLREVKIAWAKGDIVQYFSVTDSIWDDWDDSENLNTDWFATWRVKDVFKESESEVSRPSTEGSTLEDLLSSLPKTDEEMGVESGEDVAECVVLIQELVYILDSCEDELACLALNKKIRDLLDKI